MGNTCNIIRKSPTQPLGKYHKLYLRLLPFIHSGRAKGEVPCSRVQPVDWCLVIFGNWLEFSGSIKIDNYSGHLIVWINIIWAMQKEPFHFKMCQTCQYPSVIDIFQSPKAHKNGNLFFNLYLLFSSLLNKCQNTVQFWRHNFKFHF